MEEKKIKPKQPVTVGIVGSSVGPNPAVKL
jgi:hypothetical protein